MDPQHLIPGAVAPRTTHIINFYDPSVEVNAGIWILFASTSAFLGLRLWCKIDRKHGLWYDDYILIASWVSANYPIPIPVRSAPYYPQPVANHLHHRSSC